MGHFKSDQRSFLFLQGPHGPFFSHLAKMLRATGAEVWRVGFNAGDRAFWWDTGSYIPYRGTSEMWEASLRSLLQKKRITDVVLYGDTRPLHAAAVALAKEAGLTLHIFEEGYMRPYWITYERGGANGNSRLMQMSLQEMRAALALSDSEAPLPPATWGDMRQHIFYGALYHGCVLLLNWRYGKTDPHRGISIAGEFKLYVKHLLLMPFLSAERLWATRRIRRGGFPYHVALLQLEHDSALKSHSSFENISQFLAVACEEFAKGAPKHHHLVIKAHPLDDGRAPVRRTLKKLAQKHGLRKRLHFVRGGKLARLLDNSRSAVTVNSTAGQQVLWRGIPLKAFGSAVYAKPELVSDQPLRAFFASPSPPDNKAYKDYRRYLLETSQVPGGFYAARSRRQLLRHVVDMLLSGEDPYDALLSGTAAPRQQLRIVS